MSKVHKLQLLEFARLTKDDDALRYLAEMTGWVDDYEIDMAFRMLYDDPFPEERDCWCNEVAEWRDKYCEK